ncbi:C4-dicarboxylate transporter DctA [Noviherbaspirillum sp. 1P10PC]|uniref:C4-dicarboxylate transporter DctA n=1 Tax=Noviherbaspirillum sp. 1P10PC TaxID=3132292 RepID=UPI0039A28546
MHLKQTKKLYVQVLLAITFGIMLGHLAPDLSVKFKPLGDLFIRLVKMMVAPVIFVTVAVGIAKGRSGNAIKLGRLGFKAIMYFEIVTFLAMVTGMAVGLIFKPGSGMNVDLALIDTSAVASYKAAGKPFSIIEFLINIVPTSLIEPFYKGEMLQVVFLAIIVGFALALSGDAGKKLVEVLEWMTVPLFRIIGIVMQCAPVGAFGAMAFTIGKFGIGSLTSLGLLMACFYLTCAIFIVVILGSITRLCGFSLWAILKYFKDEALIVFGCASNEAVLPALVHKLQQLGCRKAVVGLVLPMSYAMNLDGACIYYTMAIAFMSQALDIHLTWLDQLTIFGVLLLTSKGSATVTGGGFITLAATLATVAGKVPVEAMILLLGVDRFISEARAFTNFCGNVVATIALSRMEDAIDLDRAGYVLANPDVTLAIEEAGGAAGYQTNP